MTKPLPRHRRKHNTLSQTYVRSAIQWDAGMMAALEACVRADLPVKQTVERLGVSDHALARGLALRLQQLLPPEPGHD